MRRIHWVRRWQHALPTLALTFLTAAPWAPAALAQAPARTPEAVPKADQPVIEAREALRRGDRTRLAALRAATSASGHPLAMWVDYWELGGRLNAASVAEVDAFLERWRGTYVEDRLRNDWLLELGRRQDWTTFAREQPRFLMNDDREVTCYGLLIRHRAGEDVRQAAREAWFAQRDADEGCQTMGAALYAARVLRDADVWQEIRLSTEANRPKAAKAAAQLLGAPTAAAVGEIFDQPARYLAKRPHASLAGHRQLLVLAAWRAAAADPDTAASLLEQPWAGEFTPEQAGAAWAGVARQAAMRLHPAAASWYQKAWAAHRGGRDPLAWSDDTLAWAVRAALRNSLPSAERWALVQQAVEAMSPAEQADPAWVYWRARAVQVRAAEGKAGDPARAAARQALQSIASPFSFYGKLAAEDLGRTAELPPPASPLTPAEREAAQAVPGLRRGLHLIAIGLRSEGVREWNFTLRGMSDRELLAAAQLACEREVWDRCINTSDRTRQEVDLAQRFPTPFRDEVSAAASRIGLDTAVVYGLIRQESRFLLDARSHVGASGLMQLMPATARWTARKIGLDYRPEMITDREVNLRLGTAYLKLVLDDFGGSLAMAAAAYNAGPGRPRRWREGSLLEVAAWAEGIPFQETRDYVKKVLSNASLYAAVMSGARSPGLKARLGPPIGPREASAPPPDKELP